MVDGDGHPINALAGFLGMLARVYAEEKARGIFVAWDTLGHKTYRDELWPSYQGGRVFDREIVVQLRVLPAFCHEFGCAVGKEGGYEADDLMASAALAEVAQGGTCLLYTSDKDSYQLVCDEITVISPQRGTRELARIGTREVVERLGVLPIQVPDFKALSGDASDKIPGVRGIGPKAASSLLLKHGTLDQVVEALGNPEWADLARMFREVATMRPNAKVSVSSSPDMSHAQNVLKHIRESGIAYFAKSKGITL